ncbi:MAG: DUF4255 domain-containing protein [Acidimicrobiia bacterium]
MIQLVDQALERYLRSAVPLPATVDVSFHAPEKSWAGSVTTPTVNLFLWDVARNTTLSHGGVQQFDEGDGIRRRRPHTVVDLRYLVTAWAGEHRDEHQLLGAVLVALLAEPVLTAEHLPPALVGPGPVTLTLAATDEDRRPQELWSALDGQLKPGLQLTATLPVDAGALLEVGPPTTALEVRSRDRASGARSGRAVVEEQGRFATPPGGAP